MCTYAPMLYRQVFLVCFDDRHRVALVSPQAAGARAWTLPGLRRQEYETYAQAARRLACALGPPGALAIAGTEGRVQASAPARHGRARRREARVFIAHAAGPTALTPPTGSRALRWVPYRHTACAAGQLAIPELGAFLDGYVGGWIPDGWITLGGHP